jgi:hypothetical protein
MRNEDMVLFFSLSLNSSEWDNHYFFLFVEGMNEVINLVLQACLVA